MPQTKKQEIVYTVMMVCVMVYGMVCYNIALDVGGMQNFIFAAGDDSNHTRIHPWILVITARETDHSVLAGMLLGGVTAFTAKAVVTTPLQ